MSNSYIVVRIYVVDANSLEDAIDRAVPGAIRETVSARRLDGSEASVSEMGGCETCTVVGLCPRCDEIVCWGHHRNVEGQLAAPASQLREDMQADPLFTERCTRPEENF
jgi:hypothetical protein